jgi:hypothetical protein
MSVVMPLVGVIVGGLLVLVADRLRRRAEWRHQQVQRLLDAGIEIIAVHNRICGDLLESRGRGRPLPDVHAGGGLRRETSARFFALPGSEALRAQFTALAKANACLRRAVTAEPSEWEALLAQYEQALLAFLEELRRIVRRGRVPSDPASSLAGVMAASSPAASAELFVIADS